MESHREIEQRAAAFLARRDGGDWSQADADELRQWMESSVAHRVALLRLEAVWEQARKLKTLAAGLPAAVVPAAGEWQKSPFFADEVPARTKRGSQLRRFAAAAALVVAVGASIHFYKDRSEDQYVTPIGGLATVPLSDGSNVTLNTTTKIRLEFTPDRREVRLDRGEAFFVVAKDTGRPFVVSVADKRIIAVGTRFSVRRDGDDVRVEVAEGKVRVQSGPEGPHLAAQSAGDADVLLTPGGIAKTSTDGIVVQERKISDVEDDLTWRQGYLTFRDSLLSDVVAQFNRYNTRKLRIADEGTGTIRISGTFRAQNSDAFVRIMSDGFGVRARSLGDETILGK
jgi:transmembrane sensor